jgi:dihydrofolate synthase/folylpolyglutamate synthase
LSRLTYAQLITELFPRLSGGIRWGLERTQQMLAAAGNPHRQYVSLHVGGTNGKGSVAATMASVLQSAGLCTGLYTSPHLCTFRERIQIDGRAIGEAALLDAAERLWPTIEQLKPSFFEATTAIGLLSLADAEVDVGVIEVGLGGRLDATNVIEPAAVALTNVALDHVQFLGPTLAAIAREKAGIFKPGVPAVSAERSADALPVLQEAAHAVGAPLELFDAAQLEDVTTSAAGTSFTVGTDAWGKLALFTPLPGLHQAANAALAVLTLQRLPASLRPSAQAVEQGVAHVRWPGRLQIERIEEATWVFDVAHNVAAVQALAAAIPALALPHPWVILIGVLGDKDWRSMLGPLYEIADTAILTLPATAPAERRWDPDAVLQAVPHARARAVPHFATAMQSAREHAGNAGTILVTGSFHTVGDAMIALGRAPHGADAHLPVPSATA